MKLSEKFLIKPQYIPFVWLFIGTLLFSFATGLKIIPITAWIAPLFLIRFLRSQKILRGIILILLSMIISQTAAMWGNFPIKDRSLYILVSLTMGILIGIIWSIPFIADRIISFRMKGFIATLVFPITAAVVCKLLEFDVGTGSTGAKVVLQYGNLPLEQAVSIFGYLGLGFFILWFSSLINWCWEREFKWIIIKNIVLLYTGIFIFIMIYGGARLSFGYPEQDTVRVAGITIPIENAIPTEKFTEVLEKKLYPPIEKNVDMLERLTKQASGAGAKIVTWQEYAFFIHKKDEKRFIDECSKLARHESIYLVVAYGVFNDNYQGDNKAVLINPGGIVDIEYKKHYLVQGAESPYMKIGTGELPVIKTRYGTIGIVICHDIHFPDYIIQAAKNDVDIMLAPSLDWKSVTPISSYWSTLSAIENGFSMIKPTGNGLSIMVDYHGRVLSSMDYFTTKNGIIYADVPVKGIKTIYSYGGYFFGWLCVIGFCICIVLIFINKKK